MIAVVPSIPHDSNTCPSVVPAMRRRPPRINPRRSVQADEFVQALRGLVGVNMLAVEEFSTLGGDVDGDHHAMPGGGVDVGVCRARVGTPVNVAKSR